MLFDEVEREYAGPKHYAEPRFAYMNRSARPEIERIRHVLEDWFSRYPSEEQPDLRARFKSTDDIQHDGAFFELFLHELVIKQKCKVVVHPELPHSTRSPDFLVISPDGKEFYLEAVIATDKSKEEQAAIRRINTVYDVLNQLDSPDFFLKVKVHGVPRMPPPARKWRTFLADRLAELSVGNASNSPPWRLKSATWDVEFEPIPKSAATRGRKGVRPLGAFVESVHWVDCRSPIRNAVSKKAKWYGQLCKPYIVAVNVICEYVEEQDVVDALFGDVVYEVMWGGSRKPVSGEKRIPNGAWKPKSGTRVSAVLVAFGLKPWNITGVKSRDIAPAFAYLYLNPWAKQPSPSFLNCFPRLYVEDDRILREGGESPASLLGLPENWLEEVEE